MVYVRKYLDDDFADTKRIIDSAFNIDVSKIISTINSFSLVAISNDKVVGHVRVDCMYDTFKNKNYFYIGYICVDVSFRRLGIGTLLIDEVIKLGLENDISYIELTSSPNKKYASFLYRKSGFEERETNVFRRLL